MKYAIVFFCFMIIMDTGMVTLSKPIEAFKPSTHMYLGNTVLDSISRGSVEIDGKNYPIDQRIVRAISAFPDSFRAGVVGPDGFPDILVGQSSIHPDTRCDNGKESNIAFCEKDFSGHSFSYQWLRHVYDAGWDYYNFRQGDDDGKKALAFTYGFLTHAAGDMWAHTLVNSFAKGIYPAASDILSDQSKLGISLRHIIVETYIGKHTPDTQLEIDAPTSFIYSYLIDNAYSDSRGQNSKTLGLDLVLSSFIDLRDELEHNIPQLEDSYSRCKFLDVTCLPIWVKKEYSKAWLEDINDGLRAWPKFSQDIAHALFSEKDMAGKIGNFEHFKDIVNKFVNEHLLSMLGFPDAVGWIFGSLDIVDEYVASLLGPVLKSIKEKIDNKIDQFENYILKQVTGVDLEKLKGFLKNADKYINTDRNVDILGTPIDIGFSPDTSQKLDALMGIHDGTHNDNPFDPEKFAPAKNTVTMTKLLLLSPTEVNNMLTDHGVHLLADNGIDLQYTGNNGKGSSNAMLEYIRSLDANHQWRLHSPVDGRQHSEGMPIWKDCSSRIHVFREIFTDWENGASNFPDLGEPCIDRTPPVITVPTSPLVIEATSSQGAIVQFDITAVDEIDGPVSVICDHESNSQFPLGESVVKCNASDRSANSASKEFVVRVQDTTPPETTITSAKEGNNFDVINGDSTVSNEITFRFTAQDLVGIRTIQCSLDGSSMSDCNSPINYKSLSIGNHHFEVQATDTSGNKDPTPATFTWKVLTPKQATEKLLSTVNGLKGVNSAVKTSLDVQLNQALKVLSDKSTSNDWQACYYLGSFIKSVNTFKATGLLSTPQADNLKQQAVAIQKANGCGNLSFGIPGGIVLPF